MRCPSPYVCSCAPPKFAPCVPFHQVSSGGTIIDGSNFARTAMAQEFGISAIHFVPVNDGEHGGVFEFGVCSSNKLNKITMQVKRGV